ncbi:hypothetical protein SAMN05421804_10883 [Proteiniclasticum ruminis]|uniref:Uncharacterized protein n=1 Tax=Proteiniclasticum ruminis TaxID=398199 RepID=A0A1G8RFC7_9CLOT|nr:hypothetical protein SAMN05421804_10883 [Proteiniclasticum ruminis]
MYIIKRSAITAKGVLGEMRSSSPKTIVKVYKIEN